MALIYVTGGAKSGKSGFAEELLLSLNNGSQKNIYLATSLVYDEEMRTKVELHRERRQNRWITVESYKNFTECLKNVISCEEFAEERALKRENSKESESECEKKRDNMLVDCLTNMISNIILENEGIDWDKPEKKQVIQCDRAVFKEVESLIEVSGRFENTVIVSNELGMGIVPATPLGRYFREIAGKMNQYVAEKADEVYFVVSGIPVKIK